MGLRVGRVQLRDHTFPSQNTFKKDWGLIPTPKGIVPFELMGQFDRSAKCSQPAVLADFFFFFFCSKLTSEPTGSRAGLFT